MPPTDFCSVSPDNRVIDLDPAHPLRTAHAPRGLLHRLWHLLRDGTGALGQLLDKAFDWYGCRHQALRCRRDLSRLDEAMLKDIGLSRADIEREIEKPFWRL
ncbi:MAG TPA: DUF1127 domain-containing protein [Terriglobales bacterium]|nr:DUF1127 domain-containing protein [Terriglobales bacterium]